MASFEATVEIGQAQPQVFWFLMDHRNNLRWQSSLVDTGACSQEPVGLGSRFWEIRSVLGRRLESWFELVDFQPPLLATTRCTAGPIPFVATYRLEETYEGCRLAASGEIPEHGLPRMAGRLVLQAARRDIHRDLARLKALLEDELAPVPQAARAVARA